MRRIWMKAHAGKKTEGGFSILEAVFASFIMVVGICGLMALFVVAAVKNAGHGDQATRCTEYAQDKMEQLLALSYNDTVSNTVGATTSNSGGVGLTAGPTGGLSEAANYSDFVALVNNQDAITASPAGALYAREWYIQDIATTVNGVAMNVKQVTVQVTAQFTPNINTGAQSIFPQTTLVAVKSAY